MEDSDLKKISQLPKQQVKRKTYRILKHDQKLEAISMIKEPYDDCIEAVANLYQIPARSLKRWSIYGIERKPGCGRKKKHAEGEQVLAQWVLQHSLEQQKKLTRQQISQQAVELFKDPKFKASKVWLDNFMRDFDLSYIMEEQLDEKGYLNLEQAHGFAKKKKIRFLTQQNKQNGQEEHKEEQQKLEVPQKKNEVISNKKNINQCKGQIEVNRNQQQPLDQKLFLSRFLLQLEGDTVQKSIKEPMLSKNELAILKELEKQSNLHNNFFLELLNKEFKIQDDRNQLEIANDQLHTKFGTVSNKFFRSNEENKLRQKPKKKRKTEIHNQEDIDCDQQTAPESPILQKEKHEKECRSSPYILLFDEDSKSEPNDQPQKKQT